MLKASVTVGGALAGRLDQTDSWLMPRCYQYTRLFSTFDGVTFIFVTNAVVAFLFSHSGLHNRRQELGHGA